MKAKKIIVDDHAFALFYLRGQIMNKEVSYSATNNTPTQKISFSQNLETTTVYIREETNTIYEIGFPTLDIPFTEKNYLLVAWITKDEEENKSLVAIRNLTETHTYINVGNIENLARVEIKEEDTQKKNYSYSNFPLWLFFVGILSAWVGLSYGLIKVLHLISTFPIIIAIVAAAILVIIAIVIIGNKLENKDKANEKFASSKKPKDIDQILRNEISDLLNKNLH